MKFTPRKLFLLLCSIFSILFCYTVFSSRSSVSSSLPFESTSWKVSKKTIQTEFGVATQSQRHDNSIEDEQSSNKIVNNVESPVREDDYIGDDMSVVSKENNINQEEQKPEPKPVKTPKKPKKSRQKDFINIPCNINNEYKIDCLKSQQNSSVYIPFNFIKKYFEINGKIVSNTNGQESFDWSHSYSKIFYPDQTYSYSDKYLWFENFNVELRERVLCTSAVAGVPISTQWFSKGHFYPTQIAQYGLSHFNKNITEQAPKRILLFQNSKFTNRLRIEDSLNPAPNDDDGETFQDTKTFESSAERPLNLHLGKNSFNHLIADFELRPLGHFNITLTFNDISERDSPSEFTLIYSTLTEAPFTKISSTSVPSPASVYGLTSAILDVPSFRFTRDLHTDLLKSGLTTTRLRQNITVTKISFSGQVRLQSLALLTSAHGRFAEIAGEWFVNNQNELGGWDIKVRRKLQKKKSNALILEPGWHSAMAQGHAISLLVRLYRSTKDQRYIDAAKRALKPFQMESVERGVRAKLFDKLVWYEEYPTVPSIFVLNGFIYSLFGLYDLSKACDHDECKQAKTMFNDGIHSLEEALLLFDSGSGTFYDLRHLALGGPPNVARWDYHSTHINQLLQLNTIVKRDLFENTIERWTQYMKGHRAAHN